MKDNIRKGIDISMYSIDIIFILYTIIIFILKEKIPHYIYSINASFFMLLAFATIMLLGYQKDKKNRAKLKATNTILIVSTLFLITIYLAGNATSFIKNTISIPNIIYLMIYFVTCEVFRYTFYSKCNKNIQRNFRANGKAPERCQNRLRRYRLLNKENQKNA